MTLPVSSDVDLVRARAKVLAGEHRRMRAELIRLRDEAGLTQKQVGERIGITQQAVNKFERYDGDPRLSTLRKYANAVGAIIEHRVSPDVGQSALVAAPSPWELVGTIKPGPLFSGRVEVKLQSSADWIPDARRSDFALSA